MSDVYEPGSVEKALTLSSLIDSGEVTPRTKIVVPPELHRDGRVIGDWFSHGQIHLTLAGVLALSSNIGTVRASDRFAPGELRRYLAKFGLGQRTDIGMRGETPGILPAASQWTNLVKDRIATALPSRAAATAWFAPLPPASCRQSPPTTVSPGAGWCSTLTTRSAWAYSTTACNPAVVPLAPPSIDTTNASPPLEAARNAS